MDSRTAPAVGTVTAETPLSAIAAIDGAARHDFRAGWRDDGRDDGRDTLSVPRPRPAGHRGSSRPEHRRERGRPRGRGLGVGHADGRPRSTPGSTSRPTTASASPGRSPRPPLSGTGSAPPPPARGRRRMADAPSAPTLSPRAQPPSCQHRRPQPVVGVLTPTATDARLRHLKAGCPRHTPSRESLEHGRGITGCA